MLLHILHSSSIQIAATGPLYRNIEATTVNWKGSLVTPLSHSLSNAPLSVYQRISEAALQAKFLRLEEVKTLLAQADHTQDGMEIW